MQVNFVLGRECLGQKPHNSGGGLLLAISAVLFLFGGCSDGIRELSTQEILEFNRIGPDSPTVDMDRLVRAKHAFGPYQAVPDDVLELTMPSILQVVTAEGITASGESGILLCRVRDDGIISLPVAGDFLVAGRTLAEIEKAIVNAYYPKYTQERPSVFVRVAEHKTYRVSVTGAVNAPGVYALTSNQMSLADLLREAGGIIIRGQQGGTFNGASVIRIERVNPPSSVYTPHTPVHFNSTLDFGNAPSISPGNRKKLLSPATFMDSQGTHNGQDAEIGLSFKPLKQGSTIGHLSVKRDERLIAHGKINLTSEAQRLALLSQATRIDPSISIVDLNAKLSFLLSMLYGHSVYDTSIQFASAKLSESPNMPDRAAVEHDIQKIEQYRDGPVSTAEHEEETIVLPVKGMNIPYVDLALQEGDRVIVEQLHMPLFAVLGLVGTPGNYEYPPGEKYNLVQAIAFAGGLDPRSEPRYVTVYRLRADQSIARIVFKLKEGSRLTDQLNVPIKPGDVVSVEHTPRTRKNQLLREIINVNLGAYFRPEEIWEDG